jgi:hypothetical protein
MAQRASLSLTSSPFDSRNLAPNQTSDEGVGDLQGINSIGGAGEDRTRDLLTASGVRAKSSDPFSFYGLEPNAAPAQSFRTLQQLQELWLGEALSSKFDEKSGTKTDTVIFLPSHLVNPSLFIVRPDQSNQGPAFHDQPLPGDHRGGEFVSSRASV